MASSDVRDVLNLPDSLSGQRPAKKQKLSAPRPNLKGLAREVQNLGGDSPIVIVPETTQFKKRRLLNRKPAARWELRAFRNSGRDDGTLILRHWRRKEEKNANESADATNGEATDSTTQEPALEDSSFAKFNVQVSVPEYSEDQYQQFLQSENWSKQETDYLMGMVKGFDLRWPLIWDRYEWNPPATNGEAGVDGDESKAIVPVTRSRTMEDLKARYYEIAAKMMALQKPVQYMTQPEYHLHEIMAQFSPKQEQKRKAFANASLSRSPEDAREEESLLLEVKRILARSERFNEERKELYNRLDYPHGETDISNFKSSTGLATLLQNLMNADKTKKRKSLMGADGVSPSGPPAPQNNAAQEPARRESNSAATTQKDPPSTGATATPTTGGKKGGQQPIERRKLTEQEDAIYGVTRYERLGSGPAFRTEKVNKLFSHKSGQQQLRITNTLNELDIPSRLVMPTAATVHQFESLLASINGLLDARKLTDKLDAEIKLEQAKKAEREKAAAPPSDAAAGGQNGEVASGADANGTAAEGEPDEKTEKVEDEALASKPEAPGDEDQKPASDVPGNAAPTTDGAAENGTQDKAERPGSSGAVHKRSASVLSSVSDKSSKRQKK